MTDANIKVVLDRFEEMFEESLYERKFSMSLSDGMRKIKGERSMCWRNAIFNNFKAVRHELIGMLLKGKL